MTRESLDLHKTGKDVALEQTLVFKAGEEIFGISLGTVLEVFQPSSSPRPVPGAPQWIAGILHHQGEVLPVVRADILLKTETEQQTDTTAQLMLLDLQTQKILLQVESIVALESIQSGGPMMSDGNRRAWLKGRLLTILNTQNLNSLLRNQAG